MQKGFWIFAVLFLTLPGAGQEEAFPVFKYDDFDRTIDANWEPDSFAVEAYKFNTGGAANDTSREFSPTSFNPRRLLGDKVFNGLLALNLTTDSLPEIAPSGDIRFKIEKKVGSAWKAIADSITWTTHSATGTPDSTTATIKADLDKGRTYWYITDPRLSNTDRPLETHPSSIHRIIIVGLTAAKARIELGMIPY